MGLELAALGGAVARGVRAEGAAVRRGGGAAASRRTADCAGAGAGGRGGGQARVARHRYEATARELSPEPPARPATAHRAAGAAARRARVWNSLRGCYAPLDCGSGGGTAARGPEWVC